MGKINILPFAVANLIAAGEVVDRPASVVKELMENAIDAGADRITVEIRNGGVTFMRVTDNGCGMSPEDLPVALRRHATSKIRDAADLDGIMTLGFRGEALAAISSVSDVRIFSKTRDAAFGAALESHGGEILSVTEQGCSDGTSVIVENLFANVPARRKFLKKDVTEAMAVTANVEKVALSHPEIAFRLIVDGNIRLETAGDGNLQNTVYAVFGREFATRLIEVNSENDGIRVSGFIGRTDNFKANRNYENFFINGRYVKSKTAMAATEQAYTSYMPPEKFPVCVLFLTINPAKVDVNVHPAKLEVKFSNEKAVFEAIYYSVRTALENNASRPDVNLNFASGGRRQNGYAGRMADRMVPVREEKGETLAKRQLSYDLTGRTQPQPQERMTAEEYRERFVSPSGKRSGAPIMPVRGEDVSVKSARNVPIVQTSLHAENTSAPVDKAPVPSVPSGEIESPNEADSVRAERKIETIEKEPDSIKKSDGAKVPERGTESKIVTQTVGTPTLLSESNSQVEQAKNAPDASADASDRRRDAVSYRIVGEVFHSYVIVETEEKMLLIDKHAAHERILFEQLKAGLYASEIVSQILLLPIDVMMTSAEVEALREYGDELEKIGFSLRFARNTVSADAIPEGVEPNAVSDMLGAMAGRILNATGNVRLTRNILFEKALYQAACKAAIKAGRAYAEGHVEWIVQKLMEIPDITFCPHGRPVALELSHRTLDKQFDRTGF